MSYRIIWQPKAELTYYEEADFILRKWNFDEVQKFQNLVSDNLMRLSENPSIGEFSKKFGVYRIVISKQTSLYYSFNEKLRVIDLHIFWNNLKNPEDLAKFV